MFEINDERLGKLKIFNVTEARANFADVLKEPDAKVVVTRHGRPTKILLSYEEYLSLLSASNADSHQSILEEMTRSEPVASHERQEAKETSGVVPPKWVKRDAEQIVSSLKGLFNK
jgi:prevent-host-death family protein